MSVTFHTIFSKNCSFAKAEQELMTTVTYVQVKCTSNTEKLFSDM